MLGQGRMITFQSILLAVLCFTILFTVIGKILSIYERQYTYMREVVLYWDGRSCHFQGYADSGNLLRDPVTKKPVSTISRDAWEDLLKDAKEPCYHRIPYRTIGTGQEMMQVAQIDYMVIKEGSNSRIIEQPMIAITEQPFAGIFQYSILLHNDYC